MFSTAFEVRPETILVEGDPYKFWSLFIATETPVSRLACTAVLKRNRSSGALCLELKPGVTETFRPKQIRRLKLCLPATRLSPHFGLMAMMKLLAGGRV